MNTNNADKNVYGPEQEKRESVPRPSEPVLNIPPVTLILLVINLVIFGLRYLVDDNFYETVLIAFSFIPYRITVDPGMGITEALSPLTYMFLHGNTLHILMNMTMLVAIGSGIEKVLGAGRYIVFYFLCGLIALCFHLAFYFDDITPLVGASGAISGLFGGILILMQRMGRFKPGIKGLLPIILIWTFFNIIIGMIGIPGEDLVSIGWIAHLGGFYAGLIFFPLFLRKS